MSRSNKCLKDAQPEPIHALLNAGELGKRAQHVIGFGVQHLGMEPLGLEHIGWACIGRGRSRAAAAPHPGHPKAEALGAGHVEAVRRNEHSFTRQNADHPFDKRVNPRAGLEGLRSLHAQHVLQHGLEPGVADQRFEHGNTAVRQDGPPACALSAP